MNVPPIYQPQMGHDYPRTVQIRICLCIVGVQLQFNPTRNSIHVPCVIVIQFMHNVAAVRVRLQYGVGIRSSTEKIRIHTRSMETQPIEDVTVEANS